MSAGTRPRIERSSSVRAGALRALGLKFVVLLAAHLLAPRLAQIAAFFRSCPVHEPGTYTALRSGRAICPI